jgi:acylphosphatase
MPTLKIDVTGQVYRTGYRYFVKEQASRFRIKGNVVYSTDDGVEIVATGSPEDIREFLKFVKTGNKDSRVETVIQSEMPHAEFETFEVSEPEINQPIKQ